MHVVVGSVSLFASCFVYIIDTFQEETQGYPSQMKPGYSLNGLKRHCMAKSQVMYTAVSQCSPYHQELQITTRTKRRKTFNVGAQIVNACAVLTRRSDVYNLCHMCRKSETKVVRISNSTCNTPFAPATLLGQNPSIYIYLSHDKSSRP